MEETVLITYFGDWLRHRRKRLDLTQVELADRAGCSVSGLRKIETGERKPSKQLAELLARSLEIHLEDHPTFIKVARGELNIERLQPVTSPRFSAGTPPQETFSGPVVLPFSPTPLIGRETELAVLGKLLAEPHCHLLTITGMVGIGKTRLAIELASHRQAWFPGGVYYLSLASLTSPEFVVPAIARVIGFSLSGSLDPLEQLIHHLSTRSSQPMLLALDNLEHLLASPPTNGQVDICMLLVALIQRLPNLKILATSLERINIQGEWTYELHGLPFPTSDQSNKLEHFGAANLFIQRARQVKADFEVLPDDQPSLARVCQLVEGVPLAIELAAAWAGMLSITEIAKEIETNLDFLETSMRDLPERHRSLRAVFEKLCRLLSEEERAVLFRLSVFRGGFRRAAAEQVAGATLASLTALMSKSCLLRPEASRFDLHDIIRQFAMEKLKASGEYENTCQKFLDYLVGLSQEAKEGLRGAQQVMWINLLEEEYDNIQAALAWAFAPGVPVERVEAGLQLVISSIRFWQGRGHLREGIAWLERSLRVNDSISPALRAKALRFAGWLVIYINDSQRARTMLQESVAIYRQLDNEHDLAKALDNLGDFAWFIGDFAESRACYEESLALLRKLGNPFNIGLSLYSLGRLHVDYGFYSQAESYLNQGLSLLRGIPDWRGIAMCTNGLGRLALFQDDLEVALDRFQEALRLNHELGHKLALTECLRELAIVALKMSQEPGAIQLWSFAAALQKSLDIHFPAHDPLLRQAPPDWFDRIVSTPDWVRGQNMTLDEAAKFAASIRSTKKPFPEITPSPGDGLRISS